MSTDNKELDVNINRLTTSIENSKKDLDTKPFETATKISERSIIYADSIVDAKKPELDGVKDTNERLKIISSNQIETIKPEVAKEWAAVDAAEFKKIRDPAEREFAAVDMINNSKVNKTYALELQEKEPSLYDGIKAIHAANERTAQERETQRSNQNANGKDLTAQQSDKEQLQIDVKDVKQGSAAKENTKTMDTNRSDDLVEAPKGFNMSRVIPGHDIQSRYNVSLGNNANEYADKRKPDVTIVEDRGNNIKANTNDPQTIELVVKLAQEKHWEKITVSGSKEFKRATWLEASKAGIEVQGYEPTKEEKEMLDKHLSATKNLSSRENLIAPVMQNAREYADKSPDFKTDKQREMFLKKVEEKTSEKIDQGQHPTIKERVKESEHTKQSQIER